MELELYNMELEFKIWNIKYHIKYKVKRQYFVQNTLQKQSKYSNFTNFIFLSKYFKYRIVLRGQG